MTESNQYEIISRLNKLEKQNKYMKIGGLAFVLLVVTTLLIGASNKPDVDEEIRAKRIVVVDEKGNDVLLMGTTTKGKGLTFLSMYDSNNKLRVYLAVNDEGTNLSLIDANKNDRLKLVAINEVSGLAMYDSNGRLRTALTGSVEEDNGGELQIFNKTKEGVVKLSVDEYGKGKIGVFDRKGKGRTLKPGP